MLGCAREVISAALRRNAKLRELQKEIEEKFFEKAYFISETLRAVLRAQPDRYDKLARNFLAAVPSWFRKHYATGHTMGVMSSSTLLLDIRSRKPSGAYTATALYTGICNQTS